MSIDKIKELNKSQWLGVFIENGAGANPIANNIMQFDGSSATVHHAETPYSSTLSRERFQMTDHRAVSMKTIEEMMKSDYTAELMKYLDVNFGVFTTFQLANEAGTTVTHGYIGILRKNLVTDNTEKPHVGGYNIDIFHISPRMNLERGEFIKWLGNLGVDLLHDTLFGKTTGDTYVDYAWCGYAVDIKDAKLGMAQTRLVEYVTESQDEHVVIFAKDDQFVRLDDIQRKNKDLLLFKGSFNPLHNTHIAMLKQATAVPTYTPIPYFVLSVNTMDKGEQKIASLLTRIKLINEAGYDVMLTRHPRFYSNLSYIKNKVKQNITFILGFDTYERLLNDYKPDIKESLDSCIIRYNWDFKDINFLIFERVGYTRINQVLMEQINPKNITVMSYPYEEELSSTMIRGMIDELKKHLPENVYKYIVNNW